MSNRFRHRLSLPLGIQLLGLLVAALIAAQVVTMALTLLVPPDPVRRWNLDRVAQSLLGKGTDDLLERRRMSGPPDIGKPGWLVSQSSRQALAKAVAHPESDVVLAFYTQLPVGGVAVPANVPTEISLQHDPVGAGLAALIGTAQAQTQHGGPPPGGVPVGGLPGGGFPGGLPGSGLPRGGFPGGIRSGIGIPSGPQASHLPRPPSSSTSGSPMIGAQQARSVPAGRTPDRPAPGASGFPGGLRGVPMAGMPAPGGPVLAGAPVPAAAVPPVIDPVLQPISLPEPRQHRAASSVAPEHGRTAETIDAPASTAPAQAPDPVALTRPQAAAPAAQASGEVQSAGTPQPIPFRQPSGILSFTTPPFIEGDFIAALRQPDGSWIAVAPRAEGFPNRWQRRVALWFALSLLIVAPAFWLFTRRIVRPLEGFARAAELLGRDPAATMLPLDGPAEIGRAADAFNKMRSRLRAFVDDRTAMVGAISHDLRTPLTRLRFRVEDVPENQQEGLRREIDDMEQLISQVVVFIRDASTPGARERVDLAEMVQRLVEDSRMIGDPVELEGLARTPVEVDPVGIRRLLANLLENAIKYGEHARVRVRVQDGMALAEVVDDGPGIPSDELEHAFVPFFRGEHAQRSGKPGSGLGLAVCRSIARAHGGEVMLEQRVEGFVVSVALPLAFDSPHRRAA